MSYKENTAKLETELSQGNEIEGESVSVEASMSEWSSLTEEHPQDNKKRKFYTDGLYDPGSGEICAAYVAMSASSVIAHPFYHYPGVIDPGIEDALFKPEVKKVYAHDGRELYLALCAEMNQCPVTIFYEGLLKDIIDLRYYCINPHGVRAMAKAIERNKKVTVLNFADNFLNDDACFHLSEMLITNNVIKELNLSGCRIGPSGLKQLMCSLPMNRSLRDLDLSRNQIGDEGIKYICECIINGLDVTRLNLNCNNLTGEAAKSLTEALETSDKLTYLDLSWNKLSILPHGLFHLLFQLSESHALEELNLSWNALCGVRTGTALKSLLAAPNLKKLDLSNNRLSGEAITLIAESLQFARKLITLDLSFNPMSSVDSFKIISVLPSSKVKVQNILMENVCVSNKFLNRLEDIQQIKNYLVVTYGDIVGDYEIAESDIRDIVLTRADYLSKKHKKRSIDIALVAMQLLKENREIMSAKDFVSALGNTGLKLDDDLANGIVQAFAGSASKKAKTIDIRLLVDFVKRKWPDRQLPPTPPPEPEPEPEPEPVLEVVPAKASKKKSRK